MCVSEKAKGRMGPLGHLYLDSLCLMSVCNPQRIDPLKKMLTGDCTYHDYIFSFLFISLQPNCF